MPEYAGYTGQKSIDWLSLAKGIKGDIDQGLKAREERKTADQKLFTDASKNLSSWEGTQDKSFNTVVLGGLDQARNKALEWNKDLKSGAISRNEYQRRMSNLNESFDSLTTATKNFDQYVTSINDRQQKGLSSSFEMFSALINSDLQNVGQKSLNIGDEGDFFMVSDLDGTVQNVRNYTNMNNIVDNKIDVAGTVDGIVSKWDPVILQQLKAGGATVLTEDPRLNNAYKTAKENLIGSVVDPKNARGVASVLLDNSNLEYEMYYTKDQRNDLINKAIAKEESIKGKAMSADEQRAFAEKYDKENLIQVVQDNSGNYQPVINDKMIEDARRVVGDQIEVQLGFKTEEERGFAPSGKDGGGGGGSTAKNDYTLYKSMADAWSSGDSAALDALLKNKRYKVENNGKGKSRVIQINKDPYSGKPVPVEVYPYTSNLSDLIPYFFGTGASAIAKGEKQRQLWLNSEGGNAGTKPAANAPTSKAPR